MNSMKFSFPWNLVKLANVCSVLATRVRFRAPFSFGYSKHYFAISKTRETWTRNSHHLETDVRNQLPCVILKRLGDRMAGHRNLRNIQADIRLSLISCLPNCFSCSRNMVKHSRNSLEKKLQILMPSLLSGHISTGYLIVQERFTWKGP